MSELELLWPALAAILPGVWSYGHKKRMIWTALALLLLPVLVIILGLLVLGAFEMTWRSVVWRYCGMCFVTGCAMLLVWAGVLLWREVGAGNWRPAAVWLCRVVGVAGIGVGCAVSTLFASFVVFFVADFDCTQERDGQTVVAQYIDMDGYNYYACYGPLVRGAELLPGSWDLHVQAVKEQEERIREQLSKELGLDVSSSFVVHSNEETHGGFHNDGETYLQVWFGLDITPKIEAAQDWTALPLPEELAALAELSSELRIPAVQNGFYWFRDRQSLDSRDYSETRGRGSYNFTLAVYDVDAKILYYWVLDT